MAAKSKKQVGILVPGYTKSGAKSAGAQLPKKLFGQKVNSKLVAQAVRVYLSNQRQGNAHTQTRASVNRTKKKVYRQKGTGGARHGARSAPLYVGGGRAHGPKNFENYSLSLSKKMARMAFTSALSDKATSGRVVVADLEKIEPKTKALSLILNKIGACRAAVVYSGGGSLYRAGRNLQGLSVIRALDLNTYDVVRCKMLVFTPTAIDLLANKGKQDAVLKESKNA